MSTGKLNPYTHTGVLAEALTVEVGGGRLKYTVTVPKGTMCWKLDGGATPWVVGDLSFIEDKRGLLFHDAEHYGIRIPEDKLTNIRPVTKKSSMSPFP